MLMHDAAEADCALSARCILGLLSSMAQCFRRLHVLAAG